VSDGTATAESGNVFPLPDAPDGRATVIYNAYDGGTPCFFDKDGEALSGERRIARFKGRIDGGTVTAGDIAIELGAEYLSRVERGVSGEISLGMRTADLRTAPLYGDVRLAAAADGDGFRLSGCPEKFTVRGVTDFDGAFYINPSDLLLYKGGRLVTGCYNLYDSKCTAVLYGDCVKLPSGELPYKSAERGKVRLGFKPDATAAIVKRGGVRAECLCEEDAGDMRRAYLIIKGFDGYCALYGDKHARFFGEKKLRITVPPDMIAVERA